MYNDPNQPPNPYGQPPPPYGQPPTQYSPPNPYGQPPTEYVPPPYEQPPYGQPQYGGVAPVPTYAQPQQQPKKSRRGLWIALAIIGAIIVLACGGCAIASAAGIGFFASTIGASTTAANAYYQAIEKQDYTTAYSHLAPNRVTPSGQQVTQDLFATAAQGLDTSKGPVTSFNQTSINVDNGVAKVTMAVTRNGATYDVHLELQQINGDWKITSYDNI